MIPGDFQLQRPPRKKLLLFALLGGVGLVAFAGVVLVTIFIISAWFGRPVIFGFDEGPAQPIAFPHTRHVEDLGLDCTFCHRNVEKGAAATIPAVGLCMTCHITVGDGLAEVEKLRATFEEGQAIDWVRVQRVPDHVHFVHEAHINRFSGTKQVVDELSTGPDQIRLVDARKIEPSARVGETIDVAASQVCTICHGNVGAMTTVSQVRPLKMNDCVDCHRDNAAPTDCTTCHY